jgi:hypothetical protein
VLAPIPVFRCSRDGMAGATDHLHSAASANLFAIDASHTQRLTETGNIFYTPLSYRSAVNWIEADEE